MTYYEHYIRQYEHYIMSIICDNNFAKEDRSTSLHQLIRYYCKVVRLDTTVVCTSIISIC